MSFDLSDFEVQLMRVVWGGLGAFFVWYLKSIADRLKEMSEQAQENNFQIQNMLKNMTKIEDVQDVKTEKLAETIGRVGILESKVTRLEQRKT